MFNWNSPERAHKRELRRAARQAAADTRREQRRVNNEQFRDEIRKQRAGRERATRDLADNASFGLTYFATASEISYVLYGKTITKPIAGVRASIVESGTIFRQNRMVIEGQDFYWEHEFSPSLAPKAQNFLRVVNTSAARASG